MNRTLQRMFDVASGLLLLAAAILAVWPGSGGNQSLSVRPPALLAADPLGASLGALKATDTSAAGIVRGNIFSSSRRAPRTRFIPPGAEPGYAMTTDTPVLDPYAQELIRAATAASEVAPGSMSGDGTGHGDGDPVPALFGIVSIDGVRQALLKLRAGDPPRLFAVGDRHAGYRITAIDADRAVLVSSRGTRTLRLTRPSSRDSSENTP
ncbi:MAG: hypothetical protein V4617_11185 [Gemmatimonadota bacterium]